MLWRQGGHHVPCEVPGSLLHVLWFAVSAHSFPPQIAKNGRGPRDHLVQPSGFLEQGTEVQEKGTEWPVATQFDREPTGRPPLPAMSDRKQKLLMNSSVIELTVRKDTDPPGGSGPCLEVVWLGLNFTGKSMSRSSHNLMRLVPLSPRSLRGEQSLGEESDSVLKGTEPCKNPEWGSE